MKEQTVCFTGHRPKNLGFNEDSERCKALKEKIKELICSLIENENAIHFISGMALGTDMYAAQIVLELKKTYPQITLETAIPYENQTIKWGKADKEKYTGILEQCDKITIIQSAYTSNCFMKRNIYMVDHSDIVLAVWNGSKSGTGNTVRYARIKNKMLLIINPLTYSVIADDFVNNELRDCVTNC